MGWGKRLGFLIIYPLLLLPIIGFYLGGFYNYLSFIVLFITVPIVDYLFQDSNNPSAEQERHLIKDPYFKTITIVYVPMQICLLLFCLYLLNHSSLRWYEWLGFGLSVGLVTGGVGINLSHELMHKSSRLQQFLSKVLLVMVCYGHFIIEHVRGHHVRVATPEDPSSAPLGMSLYQFLPITILGSLKSAVKIEISHLHRKHQSLFSFHNQFWWILAAPTGIALVFFILGGWSALGFFILQSLVAIILLETVNYIEHYGLQRKKLENGQYERVSALHSWNANHWLSNALLIHLQRHSDHHAHGARPYQILRHREESPQLPSGYLGMMILAFIPPLWHAVMDKRVLSYQQTLAQTPLVG